MKTGARLGLLGRTSLKRADAAQKDATAGYENYRRERVFIAVRAIGSGCLSARKLKQH
jgi:hypothetical protein